MAFTCPNKNSSSWIQTQEAIGYDLAFDIQAKYGFTFERGKAPNGNDSNLYKVVLATIKDPKKAAKFWYGTHTSWFENTHGSGLKQDENGEYILNATQINGLSGANDRTGLNPYLVEGITMTQTAAFLKDLNYRFFNELFSGKNDATSIGVMLDLEQSYEDIYMKAFKYYYANSLGGSSQFHAKMILEHWDQIKLNHKRFLKQYKIKLPMELAEESMEKDTHSRHESISKDTRHYVDDVTRLLIASLPEVTREGDEEIVSAEDTYTPIVNVFALNSTTNFNKIVTLLNNELAGLPSFEAMTDKLRSLIIKDRPSLGILLQRLGAHKSSEELTRTELLLQNAFFKAFSHNKNNPILAIKDENKETIFPNMVEDKLGTVIENRWQNNAKLVAERGKGLIGKSSTGVYGIRPKFYELDDQKINQMSGIGRMDTLAALGITFYGVNKGDPIYEGLGNSPEVRNFLKWLRKNAVKGETTFNDIFERDGVKIRKEIKALLELAGKYEVNDLDLMYFNQEGKSEYPITLNSHLSNTLNRINYLASNPEGDMHPALNILLSDENVYARTSKIVEAAMQGDQVAQLVLLRGYKGETVLGRETSSLNEVDYQIYLFEALLQGIAPTLRSASRKLEYGLTGSLFKKTAVTREEFLADMYRYFESELAVTMANEIENVAENMEYASKHLKQLRTFDFVFEPEDFRTIIDNIISTNPEATVEEAVALFMAETSETLDGAFNTYIDNQVALMKQMLSDNNIIKDTGTVIQSEVLSGEIINPYSEVTYRDGYITFGSNTFDNALETATYNYFVAAQEQLRLIFGDLASFKNPADFHKRTSGGTSTKYNTANEAPTLDAMNRLYPRMDKFEHEETLTEIVYNDVVSANEELSQYHNDYNSIEGSDAQSHMTLDGYRSFMIRNGDWGEREKTYQYEQQLLALEILNDPKLQEIFPFTAEDFIEIFGEHTNGVVPKSPKYQGEKIAPEYLPKLAPLKPQGYGPLQSSERFTANDFTKVSVTPLFPSQFKNKEYLLKLMANNVEIINFRTGKKGDRRVNSEEQNAFQKVNVDDLFYSQISLHDFGIQVDIHDYFKGKVTASTQRARLEFVDSFAEGGEIIEGITELKEEYDNILGRLVTEDRKTLLEELGLFPNEQGLMTLEKEDVPKFKKRLLDAFTSRNMPFNVVEGLDIALESDHQLFDFLVTNREVESVLISLVRNDVLSRKLKGELLVQESSVIYDDTLKFYSLKDNKVSRMQVKIPLPDSLRAHVARNGGLEEFNRRLKAGEIDKRIFEIPANRIPSHGPSTLEAMEVVEFLPNYVGAKIVLPAEITVKSGSDFDVDKLTTYYKHFEIDENDQLVYVEPEGSVEEMSRKQLENRLMEISNEILLHPARFKDLIKPTKADTLKKLSKKYEDGSRTDVSWSDTISLPYNVGKAKSFWSAKAAIALTATHTVSHATTQKHPVKIDDFRARIWFKGQEKLDYSMGHLTGTDGRKISDMFGEFLTAFVDADKDDFVSLLNASPDTIGAIAFLLRTGTNNGVSIEDIVSFMTQPIILSYLKRRVYSESIAMQVGQGFNDKTENIVDTLAEFGVANPKEVVNQMLHNDTDGQKFKNEESKAAAKRKFEQKLEGLEYTYLSAKDLNKKKKSPKLNQQILDNFLTYVEYGKKLGDFQKVTRPDAGMQTSFAYVDRLNSQYEALYNNGFYNTEDLNNFIGESFLNQYNLTIQNIKPFFWQFFLKLNTTVNEAVSRKLDFYRNPELGLSENRLNKIETEIENKVMTALFFKALYKDSKRFKDAVNALFTGENSLPLTILEVKQNPELMRDNMFIRELMPMIQEYDRATGRNKVTDNLKLYNRKFTSDEQNDLTASWLELFNDPKYSVLASRLAFFAMLQSGFQNSPISFVNIIPNRAVIGSEDINKILTEFKNNIDATIVDQIVDLAVRNSWQTRDIVPRVRRAKYLAKGKAPAKIEVFSSRLKNYPYVVQPYIRVSKAQAQKLRKDGKRVPIEYIMYERTGTTSQRDGRADIFQITEQYGDGMRLIEIYPEFGVNSIIPSNNVGYEFPALTKTSKEKVSDVEAFEGEDFTQLSGETKVYSLINNYSVAPNAKLNDIMINFLRDIGVKYETVKEIYDRKGQKIDARAVIDFTHGTIQAVNDKLKLDTIPEEAAHWYLKLLGENHALYKSMTNNITKYPEYAEVVNDPVYTEQYNFSEQLLREEAVAKVIAKNIVELYEAEPTTQVGKWLKALMNFLRKMFGMQNTYMAAASNILEQRVDELPKTVEEIAAVNTTNMYSIENKWEDLAAKQVGTVKYLYQYDSNSADRVYMEMVNEFGQDRVTITPTAENNRKGWKIIVRKPKAKQQAQTAEINQQELSKENTTLDTMLQDFEKYYPGLEYLTEEERIFFLEQLTEGELEAICGL